MNIKKEETRRLVRELAELTGESVTDAVTVAVRERLERVKREKGREGMAERLMEVGRLAAPHFRMGFKCTERGDLLYDERGLPR